MLKELIPNKRNIGPNFGDCRSLIKEHKFLNQGEFLELDKNQLKLKEILTNNSMAVPPGSKIDVYNPSIIFSYNNYDYIAGRVELAGKAAEHDSLVVFFRFENDEWVPQNSPTFKLQDPNISFIEDKMILSGVELEKDKKEGSVKYRMAFYHGINLENLEPLTKGPWNMKGVRITKLPNGKIGIYTRPQGDKGGQGNIGFTTADSLTDFANNSEEIIKNAPLFDTRFLANQWGGINQIIPISNDENLLIGHVAYRDSQNMRHYYPCAFTHNHKTGEISKMKLLAKRSDFPDGPYKADDLVDIVYSAGVIQKDGKWFLIVGLSDSQSGIIEIEDITV